MTEKRAIRSSTLLGIFILVVYLATLVFLPPLVQRRHYALDIPTKPNPQENFPIDVKLPVIATASKSRVSLRELMANNKNGLLVNFWATWCPPCVDELPSLEYLNRQLKGQSQLPSLVTISVDERPEDVTTLYKTMDFGPSFVVLYDKEGEFSRSIGTTKFPETYWIGPSGKILYKWVGPQDWLSGSVIRKLASISRG